MTTITLLSHQQANVGFQFHYLGATSPCGPCRFRNACLTLEPGHRYVVKNVRPLKHKCALQETDANVIEVDPVPRTLVVEASGAVVGSGVEVSRYRCNLLHCPHWHDCAGPSLADRTKFVVQEVMEEKVCLAGRRIRVVSAR